MKGPAFVPAPAKFPDQPDSDFNIDDSLPPPAATVSTLAEFMAVVDDWVSRCPDPDRGALPIWFRGHDDIGHTLLPSALRQPMINSVQQAAITMANVPQPDRLEISLNKYFRRLSGQFVPADTSPTQLYFLAQHHSLPTRLLDWTANPLSALFFAVCANPGVDGAVVIMNPRFLLPMYNRPGEDTAAHPKRPTYVCPENHPYVTETVNYLFGDGDGARPTDPLVLPIAPTLRAGRLFQQSSCFTLYMPGASAIPHRALSQYRVPADAKEAMQRSLRLMNVNFATTYFDLDNAANTTTQDR